MLARTLLAITAFALVAVAADPVIGTWKLNPAKSKYIGMPGPKDLTVKYIPEGAGWKYEATGTAGDGTPLNMSFVYVKDNEEMSFTGYPYADALVLKNGKSSSSTGTFKRAGKPVGSVKRIVSADGKTMTNSANLTLPDGKKASYTSIYEKQ